jgi:hypothetical protein
MKKFKRFKQAYRDTINSMVCDHVYPNSSHRTKISLSYAFGVGEMYEWANDCLPSGWIYK